MHNLYELTCMNSVHSVQHADENTTEGTEGKKYICCNHKLRGIELFNGWTENIKEHSGSSRHFSLYRFI